MKLTITKLETTEKKEIVKVVCDICKVESYPYIDGPIDTDDRKVFGSWQAVLRIDDWAIGPFPGQYSETRTYDICRQCLRHEVLPLMKTSGDKVRVDHN